MKPCATMGSVMLRAAAATLALLSATGISRVQAQTQLQPQASVQSGLSAGMPSNTAVPTRQAADIGDATSAWLELQRTNAAAAPALPTPGEQATLAYERYMNSFRTKIPASFGSALSDDSGARRVDDSNSSPGGGYSSGSN